MRRFELLRSYREKDIIALVLQTSGGVHVSLCGGDLPHIGAVGIIAPEGNYTVTQFPGHKEGLVCEQWAAALSAAGCRPAVIEAGIHYHGLDKAGIQDVLALTEELLAEVLQHIC